MKPHVLEVLKQINIIVLTNTALYEGLNESCEPGTCFHYDKGIAYRKVLKSGALSREKYLIPIDIASNDDIFKEIGIDK